jgi:hypothetical protein
VVTLVEVAGAQLPLSADDMKDKDPLAVVAVEHAAGWFDDLAIASAAKLPWHGPAFGVSSKLFDVFENPLNKAACGLRLVEGDIVSDGIKVA